MKDLIAILTILTAIHFSQATMVRTCEWSFSNASYDLCPYQLTADSQVPYFTVWDNDTVPGVRNFSYLFNVAASLVTPPDAQTCNNISLRASYNLPLGYCTNISSSNPNCIGYIETIDVTTSAYQVSHGHSTPGCYRLHDGVSPPIWSFYDATDPSLGVVITYTNGDYCQSSLNNRQMRLQFVCDARVNNYPDKEESVSESGCTYTIRIPTALGCPVECPIVDGALCSGNGTCDFDYTANKPKCFCYYGKFGDDCSANQDPDAKTEVKVDDSGYIAGLVVLIILLTITIGILAYLFLKLQKLLKRPETAVVGLKKKQAKQILNEESDDGNDQDNKL